MTYIILIGFYKYIRYKQTLMEGDMQHYIIPSVYFIL